MLINIENDRVEIRNNLYFKGPNEINMTDATKNLKKTISISQKRSEELIQEIKQEGLNKKDIDLIRSVLDQINDCFKHKTEKYIEEYEEYLRAIEERERRMNSDMMEVKYPYQRDEYEIPEPKKPKIADCIKGVPKMFPNGEDVNFFPSTKKGECKPQCIVLSTGNWEFGDHPLRRSLTKYWYRCFYKNRFTLIFTQSWQNTSWEKWKGIIEGYVAPQEYEIAGMKEKVNHAVVIIEYSEDALNKRFAKKSI